MQHTLNGKGETIQFVISIEFKILHLWWYECASVPMELTACTTGRDKDEEQVVDNPEVAQKERASLQKLVVKQGEKLENTEDGGKVVSTKNQGFMRSQGLS